MSVVSPSSTPSRILTQLLLLFCLITVLGGCINSSTTNPPNRNTVSDTDTDTDPGAVQIPPTVDTGPSTGLKMISAGGNHNCSIKNRDGSLWCWGQNDEGQLGDVTNNDSSTFKQTSNEVWVQVAAGEQHSCGIINDGTLSCWGNNTSGEIGNGTNLSNNTPVDISTDSVWSAVITGANHSCAINEGDSSLWCWGNNDNSQLGHSADDNTKASEVDGAASWFMVATSDSHTCAIKFDVDRRLWCWGDNSDGQLGDGGIIANSDTPIQIGLNTYSWQSISLSNSYSCGIQNNHTLWCWGSKSSPLGHSPTGDTNKKPSQIDDTDDWAKLSTSDSHACAIKTDDTLWCWGDNAHGQLGDGTTSNSIAPKKIGEDTWERISVANDYSCGLKKSDLTLWCWGNNGNLMLGHTSSDNTQPSAVDINTGWDTLATGNTHACAIRSSDETLWCWGSNSNGQLGHDPTIITNPSPVPKQVEEDTEIKWANVSVSGNHTCATKKEKNVNNNDIPTLWCWGNNDSGQLGIGSTTQEYEPTKILFASWVTISAGTNHSCALKNDGTLWCWGKNDESQLGHTPTDNKVPSNIDELTTNWSQVSLGNQFSCGVKNDNTLWCWGDNTHGQLGKNNTVDAMTPTQVGTDDNWLGTSAGNNHTCAVKQDQSLWCWGKNNYGQLGQNNATDALIPTKVGTDDNWLGVSAGNDHTCAIKVEIDPEDPDGIEEIQTLWCWGNNAVGQLGVGTTSHLPIPTKIDHDKDWISVTTGNQHTCAVDSDYIGYCWGMNDYGQLGNGITIDTTRPRLFDDSDTWENIDSGELHTCGLKAIPGAGDLKTLWCGGGNSYGQLGIGSTANQSAPAQVKGPDGTFENWKYVSTGHHHSCAIYNKTDDGTSPLYCWGKNTHGQLGTNNFNNNANNWSVQNKVTQGGDDWLKVYAGASHTCGIKNTDELWCWGDNFRNQMGQNTAKPLDITDPLNKQISPAQIAGAWLDVAVGGYIDDDHKAGGHTCAIKTDDTLWCWGENDAFQLGNEPPVPDPDNLPPGFPNENDENAPVPITVAPDPDITIVTPSDNGWISVQAGNRYTCGLNNAIKAEILLFCWGDDSLGQLGTEGELVTNIPIIVFDEGTTWLDYDLGQNSSCASINNNRLFCWGDNNNSQLTFNVASDEDGTSHEPQSASFDEDWQNIAMGKNHGCGIREDDVGNRTVYCWGEGAEYQLGDDSAWKETPQRLSLE